MDALSPYALGTRTSLWFGDGCSGHRMLREQTRLFGLGMDALVIVCSWNTNVIMVCAWMLWSPYAIRVWAWMLWSAHAVGTRTSLCYGHSTTTTTTTTSRRRSSRSSSRSSRSSSSRSSSRRRSSSSSSRRHTSFHSCFCFGVALKCRVPVRKSMLGDVI